MTRPEWEPSTGPPVLSMMCAIALSGLPLSQTVIRPMPSVLTAVDGRRSAAGRRAGLPDPVD